MKTVSAIVAILLALFSFVATVLALPPATFFSSLFASDIDGRIPFVATWGATMLCGLVPYGLLVAVVGHLTGTRSTESVPKNATGLWLTRPMCWPGVVLNASVFVDGKRVASLPVARSVFVEVAPGRHEVRLGKGKMGEARTVELRAAEQEHLTITFTNGSFAFVDSSELRAA
jgi:hypothetical protein